MTEERKKAQQLVIEYAGFMRNDPGNSILEHLLFDACKKFANQPPAEPKPQEAMDKHDVLWQLEEILASPELDKLHNTAAHFRYFWHVWNSDDERTFGEFQAGVLPHDANGNPLNDD